MGFSLNTRIIAYFGRISVYFARELDTRKYTVNTREIQIFLRCTSVSPDGDLIQGRYCNDTTLILVFRANSLVELM